ncbi:agmatinase [Candidatus Saganbacteria bacterium]|nr:agmatinase [Candidatus Saganbacteria bacterium]
MKKFLEIDKGSSEYNNSKFVIIPCPHEKTTSYGKGTKNGPNAILTASQNVENFDEELEFDPSKKSGIHTIKYTSIANLGEKISALISDNKIPIILGGEHSLTSFAVKAAKEKYKDLSVLQFDAHADLRDSYKGSKLSHASAMRRVIELCPLVQAGIRNISEEEWLFAKKENQIANIHLAQHLDVVKKIISQLSKNVYITFDVDVLDPSIMPSTGTPEPGGLFWYEILDILKEVCTQKNIVGADFVELMPIKGMPAPDFTVAKLIYKLIGYLSK